MRRGGYGQWGGQRELFELLHSMGRDGDLLEAMVEAGTMDESVLEAAVSGTGAPEGRADYGIFLSNVIRHHVREGFKKKASRWDQYVGIERAEDFREHTVSQLNGISGMQPVGEYGTYARLRSSEEEGPPYAVARYGGIYSITFELIVNDSVNEIMNRIPRKLGEMSAAYVTRVMVALLEANPNWIDGVPFFHASRGNLFTGAAGDPTETNLPKIVSAMKLRRDSDDDVIDITPTKVVTQNDITKAIVNRIVRSQETGATTNDAGVRTFDRGRDNPAANLFPTNDPVVDEPYMNDAEDYYVLADPVDHPALVAAFWRGQREPFIGMKEGEALDAFSGARDLYTFEGDDVPYKIRHIFGGALGDWQAASKASP